MTEFDHEKKIFSDFMHEVSVYCSKIEKAKEILILNARNGSRLPHELEIALRAPPGSLPEAKSMVENLSGAQVVALNQTRLVDKELAWGDARMAAYFVCRSSSPIDKAMEEVINQNYRASEILPPAPVFFSDIERRAYDFLTSENRVSEFSLYLRTSKNSWDQ